MRLSAYTAWLVRVLLSSSAEEEKERNLHISGIIHNIQLLRPLPLKYIPCSENSVNAEMWEYSQKIFFQKDISKLASNLTSLPLNLRLFPQILLEQFYQFCLNLSLGQGKIFSQNFIKTKALYFCFNLYFLLINMYGFFFLFAKLPAYDLWPFF